jgi:hypothetical protein
VANHTRPCDYDRASMGWSEPGPSSPDATRVASELHTLLQEDDEEGLYVLIGHFLAGLYLCLKVRPADQSRDLLTSLVTIRTLTD